ncbi:hypothetical protein [Streptomyces sp. NPDC047999]|uniref:hypothetical protein n=1 Tax=Streptomyces sp. NPDC047999 TaxID=3365497 RepID=UPI0037147094
MIRLASTHAAITAPLVASDTAFPGIPIGRSLLDGRAFRLSPALVSDRILPSTNSVALGGLGSGKSTTAKVRSRREILDHGHQLVVVDSFGETQSGEWTSLARSVSGKVVTAGEFQLNPLSELLPPAVREELVRSLIVAVAPDALDPHAGYALQHALTHPKATSLSGLMDALVSPEDGRWSAAELKTWGVGVAMALSRYTDGSLSGLFDGDDASLPETDLPMVVFDFTRLDRNSPAIPALMAAVACWVENVWLPQSAAPHRHLVLEEAWQILLSPATAALVQRLLKNSRKEGLSLDVVMHTLSDLGEGAAQDLARLCEIAHVGRLPHDEAELVGRVLGLPAWAVAQIPSLGPGQAVWKVGPGYVDIVQTLITEEEAELTDTSSRRRRAQQILQDPAARQDVEPTEHSPDEEEADGGPDATRPDDECGPDLIEHDDQERGEEDHGSAWGWDMPPNIIEPAHAGTEDVRHRDVLQAAREGRLSEAAQLAAIGEREDITAYGINSTEAARWLVTRAQVADLSGDRHQAATLRANVTRMGKNLDWFEQPPEPGRSAEPAWHHVPLTSAPEPTGPEKEPRSRTRRRVWPYAATAAALSLAIVGVGHMADADRKADDRKTKAAAYKGRAGAEVRLDGVKADVLARWSRDRDRVVVELRTYFEKDARYLRIDANGETSSSVKPANWFADSPELSLPVDDPLADVTVRVAVGGRKWTQDTQAPSQMIRLSPTGVAYDAETGERLPSDL